MKDFFGDHIMVMTVGDDGARRDADAEKVLRAGMTEGNSNCLEGIRCSRCGQEEEIFIAAQVQVLVRDEGTQDCGGDYEWDDASAARCGDEVCGYEGRLENFYIARQDAGEVPTQGDLLRGMNR